MHGGMSYPSQMQSQEQVTNAFTHMTMSEIPAQVDTSAYHQAPQEDQEEQTDRNSKPLLYGHRSVLRRQWEGNYPELPIPLRLLSAHESTAIGAGRGSVRYSISLWLEDRYLRANGHELGTITPEPLNWKNHQLFGPLAGKSLDPK